MKNNILPICVSAVAVAQIAAAQSKMTIPAPLPPLPPPGIRVVDLRSDEKPVEVAKAESVVEENALFRRTKATFTFTNPNARAMSGEFEFPIPEGAFVCGYSLEVNGEMVPGVVCEKEKARVAFENETRKGVDPGIVEQVKGNIWRTRIFPLNPKTPRKAEVEYIAPKSTDNAPNAIYERDGDDVFAAYVGMVKAKSLRDVIASFAKGTIIWDASLSAKPFAAAWRKKLEALPEKGEWALVVFSNSSTAYAKTFGFTKESLLKKIDEIVYDGGTDIAAALQWLSNSADFPRPALLFTDEVDTLGLDAPKYEEMAGLTVASRDDAPSRPVEVRKLAKGEKVPDGASAKESRLLATVWAARRMQDLASQADSRKDEFLALGRKYGVAGPGLSLIVLERLDQWLQYKIEPPESLSIHAEWVKRRAADDDPIAAKKAKAEHEQMLLKYWEERVRWWKDPKPPRRTPKSGVFDSVGSVSPERSASRNEMRRENRAARAMARSAATEDAMEEIPAAPMQSAMAPSGMRYLSTSERAVSGAKASVPRGAAGSGTAPTVTLKAWDPKTPYIDALKAAPKGEAYKVYLKEREKYASSPAFYLDCAGWFYKAGITNMADRILSNLAEFRLEDAALWRTMGWRAREAGSYNIAVPAFRKVLKLRGEEAQSRRDLALVLMESGKAHICDGDWERVKNADEQLIALRNCNDPADTPESRLKARLEVARRELEEAMKLFADAAFNVRARRSGRRGNDFQVSVIALEELNGLISWVNDVKWPDGKKPAIPEFDSAYRRDLPVKLRIVMSWDADQTDIDLHVLEPNGEECYYGHRRTAEGGFVSEDVTTGYGPEEYLKKELEAGVYKVLSNYFASHQTALTGATTVTATVYTDWGTAQEKRQVLTLRLEKPKSKHLIGEVKL
ncbi:MAG: DUF2135 domain-containing protein [Kiritimatiellae bacterium]|nr:DUF2135 domain-containing protein [Kiritimatiellia bacterium]